MNISSTLSSSTTQSSNLLNTIFLEDVAFKKSEFRKLSEECIFSIFAKLNTQELISVSLCCKKFKRIANDPKFIDDLVLSKTLLQLHLKFKEKDFSHTTKEIKTEDGVTGIFSFGRINPSRNALNTVFPKENWLDIPNIVVGYAKSMDVLFNFGLEVKKYKDISLTDVFSNIFEKNVNPACLEILFKYDLIKQRTNIENQFYRASLALNPLRMYLGDIVDNSYLGEEFDFYFDIENKIFCATVSNRFFFFEKDCDCFLSFRLAPRYTYDCIKYVRICDSEIIVGAKSGKLYIWDKKVLLDYVKIHTGRIFAGIFGPSEASLVMEPDELKSSPELGPKRIIQLAHNTGIRCALSTSRPLGNETDDYLFLLDHKGILKIYHLGNQKLVHTFHTKGYTSLATLHGGEVALYKKGKIRIMDFLAELPKDNTTVGKLNRIAQEYSKKLFR